MSVNFLVYGVFVYFLAIFASTFLSFSRNFLKRAQILFVSANVLGSILGLVYFFNFAPQSITLVNWNWFFGFAPTINLLSAIFFTIISMASALVGIYSVRYLELYKETYDPKTTQFLTAIFVFGMQAVLFANNAFSFLFFWEVMSIASFFLVLIDRTKQSIDAAFLYFIMTHLGASAILGGFMILGGGNLLWDFSSLATVTGQLTPFLSNLAFILFLFGFGSKAGLAPFHVWLPEAHPQAPSNISALMSGLMLKVAVFGFIKVAFAWAHLPSWAALIVIALGILSAIGGVLHAVVERDIKRAFAYSSIENMGLIFTMLGLSLYILASSSDPKIISFGYAIVIFAILHAISHAFFKTALFLGSGVAVNRVHSRSLEVMGGLAKIMPVFSFSFLIAILGSLPIPPFGTFFGEWGVIQNIINLLHSNTLGINVMIVAIIVLAVLGLVGGLAVFAMIKIFGISMLGLSRSKHLEKREEKTDYLLIMPILALGLLVMVVGIFAKNIIAALSENYAALFTFQNTAAPIYAGSLSSAALFFMLSIFLALVWFAQRYFAKEKAQRLYHTWDCGQPIDQSMEYTATAFSAPIRFFFLQLIQRVNVLKSEPVVETNPWIRKYTFELTFTSVWKEIFYEPIAKMIESLAERFKIIQGGRIQYYLLFVLGTLIITLIIVL